VGRLVKKQKKKANVHLFATNYCIGYFLEKRLVHHYFNNVFCNITSTPLLQHRFNTTFATSSYVVALQHRFCSIGSTPPLQHHLLQ
jgi:hypothetical protein